MSKIQDQDSDFQVEVEISSTSLCVWDIPWDIHVYSDQDPVFRFGPFGGGTISQILGVSVEIAPLRHSTSISTL